MTTDQPFEPDSDVAARLIRTAGRRERPPAEAYERALRAATAAWQAKTRGRRRRLVTLWLAAGLAALTMISIVERYFDAGAPVRVGQLDRESGVVEWRVNAGAEWQAAGRGMRLDAGGTLRTGQGSAAITMDNGVSVRVADTSEVRIHAPSRIQVVEGLVYVDTNDPAAGPRIEVVTDGGTAWDVGTQFEVLYRDATYRLRVREGRVVVQRGERRFDGHAGEQLLLTPAGELQRARVTPFGSAWRWVEELALVPTIDQRPLTELLEWVARETGRTVRFASLDARKAASRTVLHGTLSDLSPLDALGVILATTDFDYELPDDGTILISARSDVR